MKAAVVERFNRTFQNNYYKILMMYPKKLKRVVVSIVSKNYNLTPHSVTVFIPLDVNKDNSVTVKFSNEQLDQRDVINKLQKFYVRSYTFEVGDKVRLSHDKMFFFFSKEYRGTFSEDVFEIISRFRRSPNWHINLYKVRPFRRICRLYIL